ncbi:glycoside hydrolase family 78 protein [Paenibacillus senegalensis]|uniref:glycoside hydrolase family 78 protein n=1 Tax=Paenibacillus senegalensis TaxID=1465766 RepID=UPI000289DCE8|nr:hypothetical protein [Paenibacillus senegalensis]
MGNSITHQMRERNAEFTYQLQMQLNPAFRSQEHAGFSFRMVDQRNMYRVETNRYKTSLVKWVNGTRTVLKEVNFPIANQTPYAFKVKASGDRIQINANGVPIIDVRDSSFANAGMYGPYSTTSGTTFKGLTVLTLPDRSQVENAVLIDDPVIYDVNYRDAENDPRINDLTEWRYQHVNPNKFLNAGDGKNGLSSIHNKTVRTPYRSFDRTGEYRVTYITWDDPHPNYRYPSNVFAEYRKQSEPHSETLIVHRRPIALFSLSVSENGTVIWNDSSYDPDRWLSPTNYSREQTGINYQTTRGIVDRRYKYIAPDGSVAFGKLTRPTQTGTYTVSMTVMDEYGAWSDWYDQTIDIVRTLPNRPPTVTLTFPNGSQNNPSFVDTVTPTIRWNQNDPDPDTTFAAFQIIIRNENGSVFHDTGILPQGTTATSNSWVVTRELALGSKYQVQVRVSDGIEWSNWSNIGWMITNRPPTAVMTHPTGTQANPTMVNTLRPTLTWRQTDPDPGTIFRHYQL